MFVSVPKQCPRKFVGVFLGFCGCWCCMRLDLLLGSAKGCSGSTCISPVWLERCSILCLPHSLAWPDFGESRRTSYVSPCWDILQIQLPMGRQCCIVPHSNTRTLSSRIIVDQQGPFDVRGRQWLKHWCAYYHACNRRQSASAI